MLQLLERLAGKAEEDHGPNRHSTLRPQPPQQARSTGPAQSKQCDKHVLEPGWRRKRGVSVPRPLPLHGNPANVLTPENPRILGFEPMTRNQFQHFKQHNVPAVRSVMGQVLRWLVLAGDFVLRASRYARKRDMRTISQNEYFTSPKVWHVTFTMTLLRNSCGRSIILTISASRSRTLPSSLSLSCPFFRILLTHLLRKIHIYIPGIRHFDTKLWMSLRAIQPRTVDSVSNLFFPASGTPANTTAFLEDLETGRSSDFLVDLTDEEYREVYSRAILPAALRFNLMSRVEFQNFTKLQIPAFRSVMEQVLRWMIPSPKQGKRYTPKPDIADVLTKESFERKRFDDPSSCARDLIRMTGKCVFDDVRNFAPKLGPSHDNYPTVIVKDPTTDKERKVQETEYCRRFKSSWAWFSRQQENSPHCERLHR